MQLHKLEAYGFKSFADKLEIEFGKGITAIVGPNGSGKSNITDAIKWVLGEQNIRNLRGIKTEDIIFSGSSTRRALGIAEVTLSFDNSDGQLPLDFQEVVVTRRIFRSGESEYFINKVKCRLKDIHDLFADTGLGRDAISVISQNKIDQVLNSKPEERRLLFEEAAGITKYRNRKRESLRKLEDTQQNILRVTDVISEVENQLEPLAEHAEKTKKYNVLNERYRLCKMTVILNDYEQFQQCLSDSQKQKDAVDQTSRDMEVQIQLLEVEKEQLNNELLEVEKSLQVLSAKNLALSTEIEKNKQDMAIFKERLQQGENTNHRLLKESNELTEEAVTAEQRFGSAQESLENYRHKFEKMRLDLDEQMELETTLQIQVKETEKQLEELKKKSFNQMRTLSERRNQLSHLIRDAELRSKQIVEVQEERQSVMRLLQAYETKQATLQKQESSLIGLLTKNSEARDELEQTIKQKAEEQQQIGRGLRQMEQTLDAGRTRLKLLSGMQEEYDGFGRAAKSVLKNECAWNRGVCGAIAELIRVKNEHIIAVEIALGGNLQSIITENDQIAKQAIEYLKRGKLGRVTFLPLNTMASRGKMILSREITGCSGFLGCASELITCDSKYRDIIDYLLGRTLVVTDMDMALSIGRSQSFKIRVVTLDGEMLNPGGALTGGSNARREVSFLNRADEIEGLKQRIIEDQTNVQIMRQKQESVERGLSILNSKLQDLLQERQRLEIKQAEVKVHVGNGNLDMVNSRERIQELDEKQKGYELRFCELQRSIENAEKEIIDVEAVDDLQKDDEKQIAQRLTQLNEMREKVNQAVLAHNIQKTVIDQEIIRTKDTIELAREEQRRCQNKMIEINTELKVLRENASEIELKCAKIVNQNVKLAELRAIGVKDHDNFHQIKLSKLVRIQDNDHATKELRRKYNDQQNKMHQIDLAYTKYQFEVNNCLECLENEYKLSFDEASTFRLEESNAVLKKQIGYLESELRSLGSVNPNAIQEYEALSDRYHFMKKQADDLIVAKEYLTGIIQEIDATMSKQFVEAFEKINGFFGEIFVQLFGGGQAKLELSDQKSLLEAGIEINVQPPDKKLQSLSILSGGERALTVVALLFSFLKYRPAPFSVVDEIDASLDEANVDRFGAFLKEYAKNTQFIVVTHRKGTMQVADVMHGVTVEDSGVSRIISVRLEDQAS